MSLIDVQPIFSKARGLNCGLSLHLYTFFVCASSECSYVRAIAARWDLVYWLIVNSHSLAFHEPKFTSWGLPSDDKRWSQWTDFLSHPHTNYGFFFLLTTKYRILCLKSMKKASRKSWIRWDATWWRHFNITMTSRIDVRPSCGRRAAVRFIFPTAWYGYARWIPTLILMKDSYNLTWVKTTGNWVISKKYTAQNISRNTAGVCHTSHSRI